MAEIRKVSLGTDQVYDIAAKFLLTQSETLKTWEDIEALIGKAGRVVVLDSLPEASAETYEQYKDALVLVPSDKAGNVKDEYVIVDNGATADPRYAWEKVGDTHIDLSGYVQKNVTYSEAALENGSHEHTVSGTVAVPTIAPTGTKLSATAGKPNVTPASDKAIKGFNEHTSVDFVTSYPGSFQKLVQGSVTPAVSNGTVVPAVALADGARPTKTVYEAIQVSDVDITAGEQASFTQGAKADLQYGAATKNNFFNGASVDANGVLSFQTGEAVTDASKITSWATNGNDTFVTNVPTVVTDSRATVSNITSNNEIETAKAGTAVEVAKAGTAQTFATGAVSAAGEGDSILVGLGTAVTDKAIKTLGAAIEIDVLTGVDVAAPAVTVNAGAAGDVDVIASIALGSADSALVNGAAATAGAHKHNIKVSD